MRIALLHPTYWPEVRRGAERLVHDLGVALAHREHDVTILTTAPGRGSSKTEDGVQVVRARRAPDPFLAARGFEAHLADVPGTVARVAGGGFDVVHAFSLTDAWAAVAAGRIRPIPLAYSMTGSVGPRSLAARRGRATLMRAVVNRAAAVTALSETAADAFEESIGTRPLVLPAGVFTNDFAPSATAAAHPPEGGACPSIVCAAAPDDPRKRLRLLLEAFGRLRERRPEARLVLVGPDGSHSLPLPEGASHRSARHSADVARAFAEATVSALPAVDEAFGLVLVESLAAGTPVVAARSGASPEIVDSETVGRLFEPDDVDSLLRALDEAIDLAALPGTAPACTARAGEFDWDLVLPRYESLYERVRTRAHGSRP